MIPVLGATPPPAEVYPRVDGKIALVTGPSPRGWHRLGLFIRCPQLFAWEKRGPQGDGVPVRKSQALMRGGLVHLALAHHYANIKEAQAPGSYDGPLLSAKEAIEWYCDENWVPGPDRAMAHSVLDLHRKTYDPERFEVVAVETLADAKVYGKWRFTGRFDLVYRDSRDRIFVVDHKCEPASAVVLTPRGPVSVGELVERARDWTCCAWDEAEGKTVWSQARAPLDAGEQEVYSLQLEDGTVAEHGYKHPLLTMEGWKQTQDVLPGERVAVAIPPDLPEKDLPDPILRVLGLALADGGRNAEGRSSYVITATSEPTRKYLSQALDELGDSWALHTHVGAPRGIRLHKKGRAYAYVEALGIHEKLSVDKTFPRELLALSRRQAGLLLGALWEGDGSAYLGTPSTSGRKPVRLVYSSRSKSLTEGVRHLLLQLSIASNITETTVAGAPYYQTVVVGREGKSRFLRLAIDGTIDCPVSVEGGKKTRKSRILESFEDLLAALPEGRLLSHHRNPYFEGEIRWVRVKSNILVGKERCYDIEVPKYHTFLTGDCVVTHNTTSQTLTQRHTDIYTISGQLMGYRWLAKQTYGEQFAGLVLNLLQIRAPYKLKRVALPRSPDLEARFEKTVDEVEWAIHALDAAGVAQSEWPRAMNELVCYHRYGACKHIGACRFGAGFSGDGWA